MNEMRIYVFVLPLEIKALHIFFSQFGEDTENVLGA